MTDEEFLELDKLKRQAKWARLIFLGLYGLLETTEMPVKVRLEPILDHKNLDKVWEEIGIVKIYE
jgi:hypothetical protein